MNPDDLPTDLIHPAEREFLEEFSEDLDVDIDQDLMAQILQAYAAQQRIKAMQQSYPGSLISSLGASSKRQQLQAKLDKKKKKRSRANLSPIDREIYRELNAEVKEEGSVKDRRDYLILRLLYATGCRRSEISRMLRADLYLDEQKIIVRDGKGNKDRFVLIDKQTAELLEEHTSAHRNETPLFDIGDKQINRRVVHWAEFTGLAQRYEAQERSFTSHSLRHCFATHMYENGADLYTLRELLGHKYLSTTKIYVSIGIDTLLGKYRNAHPLERDES